MGTDQSQRKTEPVPLGFPKLSRAPTRLSWDCSHLQISSAHVTVREIRQDQEPQRNWKPEPSEPFSQKPSAELEPLLRNPNPNRPSVDP